MPSPGEYSDKRNKRLARLQEDEKFRKAAVYRVKNHRKDIDLDMVYMLAQNMLNQRDMATQLKITPRVFEDCLNNWPEFGLALERGYSETRQKLGKVQLDMALNGNVGMLIWLGKQYLHQADKHEQNNRTEISVTVQRATEELRNIPRGQLLQALEVMNMPVTLPNEAEPEPVDEPPPPPIQKEGTPV